MTIRKSIIGIVLFAGQISIATFFNTSVDLTIVMVLGTLTFGYIVYKVLSGKYDAGK